VYEYVSGKIAVPPGGGGFRQFFFSTDLFKLSTILFEKLLTSTYHSFAWHSEGFQVAFFCKQ
jgi:hypothetical protein